MGLPSTVAPPPRTAANRVPVAWFTTSATRGPSRSTTHSDVAHQGRPADAFVEPSTGSSTTIRSRSPCASPLSSLRIPTGAWPNTPNAAALDTWSWVYSSSRSPPTKRHSPRWSREVRTAVAVSCSSARRSSSVTGFTLFRFPGGPPQAHPPPQCGAPRFARPTAAVYRGPGGSY